MLFLRRNPDERICVFDSRTEIWIRVVRLDMDSATISIGPGELDDPTTELDLGEWTPILQGDGSIRLQSVGDWIDGGHYCTLGVDAPREVKIEREEMIMGMTREDRARIA